MKTEENTIVSRRGFIYTVSGLFSGVLLSSPSRLMGTTPQIKHLVENLEIELLERSRPTRHPSIFWDSDNGDFITVYRKGKGGTQPVCAMNQVGKMILDECNGKNTPRDISKLIQKRYLVSYHQAYMDCLVLLARLKTMEVIQL